MRAPAFRNESQVAFRHWNQEAEAFSAECADDTFTEAVGLGLRGGVLSTRRPICVMDRSSCREKMPSPSWMSERNHQGLRNRLLEPLAKVGSSTDPIHRRERLGGMLNFYYRDAVLMCWFHFLHLPGPCTIYSILVATWYQQRLSDAANASLCVLEICCGVIESKLSRICSDI